MTTRDRFERVVGDPRALGRGASISTRAVLDHGDSGYRLRGLELDLLVMDQPTGTAALDTWLASAVELLRVWSLTHPSEGDLGGLWRPLSVPPSLIASIVGRPIGRISRVVGHRLSVEVVAYDAT